MSVSPASFIPVIAHVVSVHENAWRPESSKRERRRFGFALPLGPCSGCTESKKRRPNRVSCLVDVWTGRVEDELDVDWTVHDLRILTVSGRTFAP